MYSKEGSKMYRNYWYKYDIKPCIANIKKSSLYGVLQIFYV